MSCLQGCASARRRRTCSVAPSGRSRIASTFARTSASPHCGLAPRDGIGPHSRSIARVLGWRGGQRGRSGRVACARSDARRQDGAQHQLLNSADARKIASHALPCRQSISLSTRQQRLKSPRCPSPPTLTYRSRCRTFTCRCRTSTRRHLCASASIATASVAVSRQSKLAHEHAWPLLEVRSNGHALSRRRVQPFVQF